MEAKRKICAITTARAEYGIMSRLIHSIQNDDDLILELVVSGMHLSDKFGHTIDEINVPVTSKIDIDIEGDQANTISLAIKKFDVELKKLKPDIVLVLGDRYEILGFAIASLLNNIPIAHIHGGETTQGAIDEAIRHSITKMSHLHFVSCEEYKKRVIQLGENPKRVFNVGALGVENIKKIPLMTKNELEKSLDFKFNKKNILTTFHPTTLEGNSKEQFIELLSALEELKDTNIIITAPNSDKGSEDIFELIESFQKTHKNVKYIKSLGMVRYLSALRYVDMVAGNSSSGIIEVPSFKIPTINIGDRQKGRVRAKSVIDCKPKKDEILSAIKSGYDMDLENVKNPYEKDGTKDKILEILKGFDLNNIIKKEFYNL